MKHILNSPSLAPNWVVVLFGVGKSHTADIISNHRCCSRRGIFLSSNFHIISAYEFFSDLKIKASLSPRWIARLTMCLIVFGVRMPDRLIWSSSGSISPL